MIIAPDVFTIDQGTYTPEIAVKWFKDPQLGRPTPLFVGRTLRYSEADDGALSTELKERARLLSRRYPWTEPEKKDKPKAAV